MRHVPKKVCIDFARLVEIHEVARVTGGTVRCLKTGNVMGGLEAKFMLDKADEIDRALRT